MRVASDASRSVSDGEGTAADANFILRRCDANLGKRLLQKAGARKGRKIGNKGGNEISCCTSTLNERVFISALEAVEQL